jgi:hypothetical protein
MPLRIDRIHPQLGWPGTLVTIDGEGFGPGLDDNQVTVGGQSALVVRAAPLQLQVLVLEGTVSGPVDVTLAGANATGPEDFKVRDDWPDVRDAREAGPPQFHRGPDHSTPRVRVKNLPVLVILAYGKGNPPANAAAEALAQAQMMNSAARYWKEVSYGETTFKMVASPSWLELPKPGNDYVWNKLDLDWARTELVHGTKRSAAVAGELLFATHQSRRLSKVDTRQPAEVASLANIGAMHVALKGNYAYVAAGTNGLYVVDRTPPGGPVVLTQVPLPGRAVSCDIEGNRLAVAALDGGLHLLDISTPQSPVLQHTQTFSDLVTVVRLTPTRAYAGIGEWVAVLDLAGTPPIVLGTTHAEAWVMDLALDPARNLCVAATDGNGLVLFDVTAATPAARGSQRNVLRLHAVTLVGETAYAAGADEGLHIVDVHNPHAPQRLSTLKTDRPCYSATVIGTWAWLGLGGSHLQRIDVANPANPVAGPMIQLGGGAEPDLTNLRRNLTNADDGQGLRKDESLLLDALWAAKNVSPAYDVSRYQGAIIVLRDNKGGRAQSGLRHRVAAGGRVMELTDSDGYSETKGVLWLPVDATWGRWAHEIGHWFGMEDNYDDKLANGTVTSGSAQEFCLSGKVDHGALFCAREAKRMQLFDSPNFALRIWTPSADPYHEDFDLVAHTGVKNGGPGINALELAIGEKNQAYFVEVRQAGPPNVLFDHLLPASALPARVVVTKADYQAGALNNAMEQPVKLFKVLDVGESAIDAARLIRVDVLSKTADNPATFRVRVTWNEVPPEVEGGPIDLRITPWTKDLWETPDIWVNSKRNDPMGGPPRYQFSEPGDDTKPILNGDKPWVARENTVFARITNEGPREATDVYVSFSTTTPPGIGDNLSWHTHETKKIARITGGQSEIVSFDWKPDSPEHTCIQIAIMPQAGERKHNNDKAQENVAVFDTQGSSSHEPVIFNAQVRSPFSVGRRVDLRVVGLPRGWHSVIEPSWVWLGPYETVPVRAVIWTDLNSPRAPRAAHIAAEVFPRVEGWTYLDHLDFPVGGVLVPIRANKRGKLHWELDVRGSRVHVNGFVTPAAAGIPMTLETVDAGGSHSHLGALTDASGMASFDLELADGRYTMQLFTASTPQVGECESEIRTISIPGPA